jgi:hypothetical protein
VTVFTARMVFRVSVAFGTNPRRKNSDATKKPRETPWGLLATLLLAKSASRCGAGG